MVTDEARQILVYWIVLIDLTLERPEEAKILRELFMLQARGKLTVKDRRYFNGMLGKLKVEVVEEKDEGVLIKNEVFEALARLEQLEVES